MKFFKCLTCGNEVAFINGPHAIPQCCGEKMVELVANSTDASQEKHVPVVEVNGRDVKVTVGSVTHPMDEAHYIEWVCLETNKGFKVVNLKPGFAPVALFNLSEDEKALNAYAYCNLHGLWVKAI